MRRVVIDAFHFVGLRGGSGGSGNYVISLIEELSRLVDVHVVASPRNRHLFDPIVERVRRLTVSGEVEPHSAAIRAALEVDDLLYAPFTSLPERETYSRVPAVTAVHDLQHRFLKSFFPKPERLDRDDAYFDAARVADGVLTFSTAEKANISDAYGIPADNIGVVPHAPFLAEAIMRRAGSRRVDRERNPFLSRYGRYVVYPAVNWPHKNHYRLVEAFRLLYQEKLVTDVKLVLTGASCVEEREHFYKELLEQSWAENAIIALGFVTDVQLFMLMQGAEALVFPSLYEGFGIPVLEAMRLGTPVLASDLPAIREWFPDCYVPFRDVRDSWSMAQDITDLLSDAPKRAQLGAVAQAHSKVFSARRTAEETLAFLTRIADEFRPTNPGRAQAHRDRNLLRRNTDRLLTAILIDIDDQDQLIGWLSTANFDLPMGGRIVWLCPYQLITEGVPDLPASSEKGKTSRRSGATVKNAIVGLPTPTRSNNLLNLLRTFGECVFFDRHDAGSRRTAVRFYTTSQADADFSRFAMVSDLMKNNDTACDLRRCLSMLRSLPSEADGIYLAEGSSWAKVNDELLTILHTRATGLRPALTDPSIGIQNFAWTEEFIKRTTTAKPDWFARGTVAALIARARLAPPTARFGYIETELTHKLGHHFALVQGLCAAAAAAGFNAIVGANKSAFDAEWSPGLTVDPCFSTYTEAPLPQVTPSQFAEELQSFLERHHFGYGDYIYLHMPYPTLIAGVLQIIATSSVEDLPVFLVRVCSTDDSFRWHDIKQTELLTAAGKLSRRRRNHLRVFVESVPLQRYFEAHTGQHLPVLLNPINRLLALSAVAAEDPRQARLLKNRVTFGYFGEAREEKGFLLLPEIIEQLLEQYQPDRIQFCIQVGATPHNENARISGARMRLRELATTYAKWNTILLHDQFPDMASYYNAMASCDAVLLPYTTRAYAVRGSGVALESLALGIPIVVTPGTDMAVTFAGSGCVVAAALTAEAFAKSCCFVAENAPALTEAVREFCSESPLIRSERDYMIALIGDQPSIDPADRHDDKPVAIWIGNDTVSQGCSVVYDAQRDFLQRQGFEIYNVYVPFPDLSGHCDPDYTVEKRFVSGSLGWGQEHYNFGCYSWMLNQSDDDDGRLALFEEIRVQGGSTKRFLKLNSYWTLPSSLRQLLETREISLVCLNYVHLFPVLDMLGLRRRKGTRVVLETHDIQAYQHAIRAESELDTVDKELEVSFFGDVDGVVAISQKEFDEIVESNPWANVELILPPMRPTDSSLSDWHPGTSYLTSTWFDIWCEREDLQKAYDLSSAEALRRFADWILFDGREEYPHRPIGLELAALANGPHHDFEARDGETRVSYFLGSLWSTRPDLQTAFPDARDIYSADRGALLQWLVTNGAMEYQLESDGSLSHSNLLDTQSDSRTPPALIEAFALARPTRWRDREFRNDVFSKIGEKGGIDVLIVGSDHPANVVSIRKFIHEVYDRYLNSEGVNLVLAGRSCRSLEPGDMVEGLIALEEVESLDPLYKVAQVIAIPTAVGSGTPIKILDAFARGLVVSSTNFVDQSLGLRAYGFPMASDSQSFARDIQDLLSSAEARERRREIAVRFAHEQLSIEGYDAKWRRLAGFPATEADAAAGYEDAAQAAAD
jgi:glycosyltransferase involved in cell wall biosynthesis